METLIQSREAEKRKICIAIAVPFYGLFFRRGKKRPFNMQKFRINISQGGNNREESDYTERT